MKMTDPAPGSRISAFAGPPQGYYGGGQGQRPSDPWYGQQPSDPYLAGGQPEPYYGQPGDPYGQGYYGQQDPYAQQAPPAGWSGYGPPSQGGWQGPPPPHSEGRSGIGAAIVGIFLVLMGVWFLFRDQIDLDVGRIWPSAAVILGVIMVIAAFIPRRVR